MRPRFGIAAAILIALTLSTVSAQTMESTPAPAPKKPNFTNMTYTRGRWDCTFRSSRRPTPQHSVVQWSSDPSGYWRVGVRTVHATDWFPYEFKGTEKITYDFDSKRWIDVYTDTLGNYDLSTSKGFSSQQITWHSLAFMPGGEVTGVTDTTYTKIGNNKVHVVYGFATTNGHTVRVEGNCTRLAGSTNF